MQGDSPWEISLSDEESIDHDGSGAMNPTNFFVISVWGLIKSCISGIKLGSVPENILCEYYLFNIFSYLTEHIVYGMV